MTFKKDKVSIIIPTFNRKNALSNCLKSIYEQSYDNFEIIIVDDASTDETDKFINSNFHQKIKLLRNSSNKGPNYSRNLGVVESEGEYLLFLDSDIELVNKNQIRNMVNFTKSKEMIGAIGGFFQEDGKHLITLSSKSFLPVYSDSENFLGLNECDIVTSGNLFIAKKLIYEIGGFDELLLGGSTEIEFSLMLKARGYKNYFGQEISAKHLNDDSERDNIGLGLDPNNRHKNNLIRLVWTERNYLRFHLKNFGIHKLIIEYFLRTFTVNLISLLAFIKQMLFGFKEKRNEKLDFHSRLIRVYFLLKILYDPLIWNIINYKQTKKCRDINFLSNKL